MTDSKAPLTSAEKNFETKADTDQTALRHYLAKIGKLPLLSHEQEMRLSHAAENGDAKARKTLIESNLRFVVHIATKYSQKGVPLRDLIAAGNHGLALAAEGYRARADSRFAAYSVWWIRRHILKAFVAARRSAHVPLHRMQALLQISRTRADYLDTHGRDPDASEIARLTGLATDVVFSLLSFGSRAASLQAPASRDGEGVATLGDLIADEEAETPANLCEFAMSSEEVKGLLNTLDAREALIVTEHFGLADGTAKTCEELGRRLGMTRERVRQINELAIRKMRRAHEEKSRPRTKEERLSVRFAEARDAVFAEFAEGLKLRKPAGHKAG